MATISESYGSSAADPGEGAHQCVLCCENIAVFAIGVCDHHVCFRCSARMRVLADQRYCAVCRTNLDQVVFTKELKNFADMTLKEMSGARKYGIRFASKDCSNLFNDLIDNRCPLCKEKESFRTLNDLRSHLRKEHNRQYCDICTDHLHVFPSEHLVYSRQDLVKHRKGIDEKDSVYKGHPLCKFCDERFYDSDELLLHLRRNHFWCHFCEKDGKQEYYCDYPKLRDHFQSDHFLCEEDGCESEKFTSVFRTKIDLQAHRVANHRKQLTKASARQARQLEIDIDYGSRRRGKRGEGKVNDTVESQAHLQSSLSGVSDARPDSSPNIHRAAATANNNLAGHISVIPNPLNSQSKMTAPAQTVALLENQGGAKENTMVAVGAAAPNSSSKGPRVQNTAHGRWSTVGQSHSLNETNFPSLSSQVKAPLNVKAPPGFPSVARRTEPPGLGPLNTAVKEPDPIKRQNDASKENIPNGIGIVSSSSGRPPGLERQTLDPLAFQARNQRLVQMMHSLLSKEGFDKFRGLSGQYRKGEIDVQVYYGEIRTLLGENLNAVFSELVDLLPDPDKRSELLAVHNDNRIVERTSGNPKGDKSWKERKKKSVNSGAPAFDADFPALQPSHDRKGIAWGTTSSTVTNAWIKK